MSSQMHHHGHFLTLHAARWYHAAVEALMQHKLAAGHTQIMQVTSALSESIEDHRGSSVQAVGEAHWLCAWQVYRRRLGG